MLSALAFLTVLGRPAPPTRHTFRWFAVVGAGLGAAVGGVHWGAHLLWPPLVAAAVALAADLLLTGALHLDGPWRTRPTGWGHRWSGRGAWS